MEDKHSHDGHQQQKKNGNSNGEPPANPDDFYELSTTPSTGTSTPPAESLAGSSTSGDQSAPVLNDGGLPDTLAGVINSKYANDMDGWLSEVAHVPASSSSSSGRSSRHTSGISSGGSSSGISSLPTKVIHVQAKDEKGRVSEEPAGKAAIDPHFYNAVASFQDVTNSGPPAQPPDFPSVDFTDCIRVNASVYNPDTDEEIVVPNVLYEIRQDGSPPEKAYWVGRKLQNAIYGCVCACSILKLREGGWAGPQGNSLWELTPTLAAVKVINFERYNQIKYRHIEDPLKEVAAMQFCSRDGTLPNVMECYDVYRDEEHVYMFMPFCSKGELFSYVKRNGRFEEPVARYWFKQLLSGLISLQKVGITHRDISLENIMINENTHALVIDLGLCLRVPFKSPDDFSRIFNTTSDTVRLLLCPQGRCGKSNYTAPEIWANILPFDGFAIDIWSMTIVLFIMLVGIPAYDMPSIDEPRYRAIRSGGLKFLLEQWKRPISPLAMDLLESMLKEHPQERLSLFQIMNHPWVLKDTPISMDILDKLDPQEDTDDAMEVDES